MSERTRQTGGDRWAFLVGIAEYQRAEFSLLGPMNDIPRVRQMLLQRGFAPDHIRVAMNREATRQGILAGWDWLQSRARPGDTVVFYYSGHGTVVPPAPGETGREMRSALVPYDTVDARGLLPGRVIGERIDRLATDQVIVIVDACHSGRASRMPCVRSRFVSPTQLGLPAEATPKEIRSRLWVVTDFSGSAAVRESGPAAPTPTRPDGPTAPVARQKELYLGASRVSQTASEDTFLPTQGTYGANGNMGAFTYYLLQEISRDKRNERTYGQIVESVRADLLRRYGKEQVREDGTRQPTQEPQLSGVIPEGPGFLVARASSFPAPRPIETPIVPVVSALTEAAVRAPLRVAVRGNLPRARRASLVKLPDVVLVSEKEPNEVVVEAVGSGVRVWRSRIPLEPVPWADLPALLSRLHAARTLERLASRFATGGVRVTANGQAAYTEAAIGERVTLAVTAEQDGFVTLLVAAADGTLTGVADMPVRAGQTLTFPATAKGPNGVDLAQALWSRERLGARPPASPGDAHARRPQEIVGPLAQRVFALSVDGSADTVLVRIRGGKR